MTRALRPLLWALAVAAVLSAVAWLAWGSPGAPYGAPVRRASDLTLAAEAARRLRLEGAGDTTLAAQDDPSAAHSDSEGSATYPERSAGIEALVLVEATTDRETYDFFEPVRIRRVFRNASDRPVVVRGGDWERPSHRNVGLTWSEGSRLYEPSTHHLVDARVAPGGQIENEILIELPAPGRWTIEVPPEYLAGGVAATPYQLPVTVLGGGHPDAAAAKAERLAGAISAESPDCPTCWTEAQKDLERMGAAAVPHLLRWVRESPSPHLRAVSAKVLGGPVARGQAGIDGLVAGLDDASADVRRMCVRALAASREPVVVTALLPRLGDPDPWVRVEALETLARSSDPRVTPGLGLALADPDEYVRLRAACALAESKHDPAGIRVLIAALDAHTDPSLGMVVSALDALTGRSFGEARMAFLHSFDEQAQAAHEANAALARRWLAWWKDEGEAQYPLR